MLKQEKFGQTEMIFNLGLWNAGNGNLEGIPVFFLLS
jgi:hypothetical protein